MDAKACIIASVFWDTWSCQPASQPQVAGSGDSRLGDGVSTPQAGS